MTDIYSQRLSEAQQAKKGRFNTALPLRNPASSTAAQKTMASKPKDPSEGPALPESVFKQQFDHYTKDDSFKQGMKEFATVMQAMRKEMNGAQLPPEMMQRRVEEVLNQYRQGAVKDSQTKDALSGILSQGVNHGY